MLGYSGLAVVGDLSSDSVILHWLLLIMFLHLPLAIWLSLVLAGQVNPGSSKPLQLVVLDSSSPSKRQQCCEMGCEVQILDYK